MTEVETEYRRRHAAFLERVADELQKHLSNCLLGVSNIDRVVARAKAPDRFAEKATRVDDNGKPKYQRPLTEIQDLVGARVIVYYRDDVDKVATVVRRYFQPIEQMPFNYFQCLSPHHS